MNVEQEIVAILIKHYQTCNGNPRPLHALKEHYGAGFKFDSLGLGKYNQWMHKNSHLFADVRKSNEIVNDIDLNMITEQQLLDTIKFHFSKSEMYSHRKHVLKYVRDVHGNRPFADYGYGTFKEFQDRHGLNMGIAKRDDFKSEMEWKRWQDRR